MNRWNLNEEAEVVVLIWSPIESVEILSFGGQAYRHRVLKSMHGDASQRDLWKSYAASDALGLKVGMRTH